MLVNFCVVMKATTVLGLLVLVSGLSVKRNAMTISPPCREPKPTEMNPDLLIVEE